jgi:hypothetical protein
LTISNEPNKPKKKLSTTQWVLVGAGALVGIILLNSLAGANSQDPDLTPTPPPGQVAIDGSLMGGKCEQVLTSADAVLKIIGIGGAKGSDDQIEKALKDTGELLTSYSADELGGEANRQLVNSEGKAMLNLFSLYQQGKLEDTDLETDSNLLADSYNSILSVCQGKTTAEPVALPLNGRCDSVLRYMDRAVVALGTYGDTSTLGDVVESLKENGETLSRGFILTDFSSQDDFDLVIGAGKDLLKMRVALLGDSDIEAPSDRFLKAYEQVKATCGK